MEREPRLAERVRRDDRDQQQGHPRRTTNEREHAPGAARAGALRRRVARPCATRRDWLDTSASAPRASAARSRPYRCRTAIAVTSTRKRSSGDHCATHVGSATDAARVNSRHPGGRLSTPLTLVKSLDQPTAGTRRVAPSSRASASRSRTRSRSSTPVGPSGVRRVIGRSWPFTATRPSASGGAISSRHAVDGDAVTRSFTV